MQYRTPSYWMHAFTLVVALVLLLVFAPSAALANTEKVVFTVRHSSKSETSATGVGHKEDASSHGQPSSSSPLNRIESLALVDPTSWKQLTSPHTILPSEHVRPSFYAQDTTIVSAKRRKQQEEKGHSSGKVLFPDELSAVLQESDLENREFQWYVLQDLEEGASFELRISYPATSPADFEMKVWTMNEAQEHVPESIRLSDHFPKDTMFARVKATYTGVSYLSSPPPTRNQSKDREITPMEGPETRAVPYNMVLERLYFHIPYQALKLAVAIALAVVVGLAYGVPTIHRLLKQISSGEGAGPIAIGTLERTRKTD